MAWQFWDEDRCPCCGNPLSETTDFELRMEWETEAVTCFAGQAKAAVADRHKGPGQFVVVKRREG